MCIYFTVFKVFYFYTKTNSYITRGIHSSTFTIALITNPSPYLLFIILLTVKSPASYPKI